MIIKTVTIFEDGFFNPQIVSFFRQSDITETTGELPYD